ncbi:MAG: GNAT family N-acetyltransferase [Pseudomonadota bacterium]
MLLSTSIRLTVCALTISATSLVSTNVAAQSSRPFVAPDFTVPEQLETAQFRLRMLTVNDVVKDYDAVMSSAEQLKSVWPDSEWPNGLTLEQNLIDLGWHQREFQRRSSFAYTVVTLDESKVVGCVYIDPTRKRGYDAEVYLWAREAALGSPADTKLFAAVNDWMAAKWPFENVAFPGREIDWESWESIPDEDR